MLHKHELTLYSYYRSTASYRVRIALALKQLAYQTESVHLLRSNDKQYTQDYKRFNPQGLVPCLEIDGNSHISQSLAIINWLDETYPEPALLPENNIDKAYVQSLAQYIVSDIHPLNIMRVKKLLKHQFNLNDQQQTLWYQHWLRTGFDAIEAMLADKSGKYCLGDQVTIADICLIPQVYNAKRFNFDMSAYPKIMSINRRCLELSAFTKAMPEVQPDKFFYNEDDEY